MAGATSLERLIRRERAITIAGMLALCALAWAYIVAGAGLGMSAWEMTVLALSPQPHAASPAPAMVMAWEPGKWMLMVAMWWVMMIAMMTPGAAPTILLYARVRGHALAQGHDAHRHASTGMFAAGYFLMWLGFSIAAVLLQRVLEQAGILSAMTMGSQVPWISGTVLLAAGIYQLSPLKSSCLIHCRAPVAFLTHHWHPYALGALRMGAVHGAYCVGCCWMLMALLFVGGVMNLAWIAALTLLVLAEKVLVAGSWVGRAAGLLLIAWGLALLLVRTGV
ncbi:MAG: DUF2182 domain-containing protein [Rhodanobacter sp.]|nr:MAG: DUF2182 domain-containing protein [Rhodanobacter sp.]